MVALASLLSACSHDEAISPIQRAANVIDPSRSGLVAGPALVHRSLATPVHVLTWMDIGANGGPNISPALVANWVNYSTEDPADSLIAHALGIHTALYTDPNRTGPGDIMYYGPEGTFAHDCSNNRISIVGKNKQLMNVKSATLWSEWLPAVQQMIQWDGGGLYDYIFEDTADSISNTTGTPCNFDQNVWTTDTNNLDTALGLPIVYNGLSHIGPGQQTPAEVIKINPTTSGGEGEECYIGRTPSGYHYAPYWLGIANTELAMQQQSKLFDCHGTVFTDAQQNTALRTYYYASYLLTYDLNTSIVETSFSTPSGVTVLPEVQLVPESPLVPTPTTIDGLLQSSGVYGREYASCYLAGLLIGPCAVAVNPNNPKSQGPLAFPWPGKYNHTLTMSGEDVIDGGTVATNGPPPPSQMTGGTGVIVFP